MKLQMENNSMKKLNQKIKIETMTIEDVTKSSTHGLHALRSRFQQLHYKFFSKHDDETSYPGTRTEFLNKYDLIVKEMKKRSIDVPTKILDRDLFKSKLKVQKTEKVELSETPIIVLKDDNSEDERIVYGIVYEPDETDTEGDTVNAEVIRKAAHYYMAMSQVTKVNHKGAAVPTDILESYLAPMDISIAGRAIKKGTWIMVVRVNDSDIWKSIKEGDLTGFSLAGPAKGVKI